MELWWIILAGCGGGLLLVAYVAVVVYKLFRRKERMQLNQYQDPERLTDDKDWATHVHPREVSERRADGLCMDTLSGTSKLRRKASIPSVSQFQGASEAVPKLPVSSQTNPNDKQNGRNNTSGPEPQASEGFNQDTSPYAVTAADRSSPEVVRRFEYTWETLLCQPSDVRRSQSFNWDDPEYKKPNGKTRSFTLASDKQGRVNRTVRSKSLRGYTHRELAALGVAETAPFDKTVISAKRRDENTKRIKSKKSPKTERTVTEPEIEVTKPECTAKNKKIKRSGSAPSARAREKVENTDVEGSLSRRLSSRWIPDPDYQAVSMEELVSAAQQQVKATRNDNVCVVEIHNVPRDRDSKASRLGGIAASQVRDRSLSASILQSSRPHENQTNCSTTLDVKTLLMPGVAKRVPTVVPNNQSPDKNEETNLSIKNTHERDLSVKNRIQNLETQVVDVQPNTSHSQVTDSTRDYTVDIGAPLTIDINNNSQMLPSWRQKQIAREEGNKPNIESNQAGQPSLKTKPEVRSIGKLTLVKHTETPARGGNPEISPKNPTREDPAKRSKNVPWIQMRQLTDTSSPRNVTLLVRNSNEQRENDTSHIPCSAPPPPPPPTVTVDSRSSRQVLGNEVKITIAPKDSQDATSVLKDANVPIARDTDTLEERKKTWKREQILDQLHSARARNGNQSYIFGTGLAYQSCMPELQNKLKQLTLAK